MTRNTGQLLFAQHNHITNIVEHMPIAWVELINRLSCQVDSKISKQIIAWNEIVGKGKIGALRLTATSVTLCTNRCDDLAGVVPLAREVHERRVF
jgi:hypothetical protein